MCLILETLYIYPHTHIVGYIRIVLLLLCFFFYEGYPIVFVSLYLVSAFLDGKIYTLFQEDTHRNTFTHINVDAHASMHEYHTHGYVIVCAFFFVHGEGKS